MFHKIGILCASEEELNPFFSRLDNCVASQKALLTVYEGKIAGIPVAMLFSGACKVNAALAAQILIDSYQVDAVLNSGTAGALAKNISAFDLVVGSEMAYHDVAEDILTEYHPWLKSIWFQADSRLLTFAQKAAERLEIPAHVGRMITGESFITDVLRERLIEKFHPLTVDMETAAVAHVCHANQTPFLAIRAVTDSADGSGAEDFEANCARASEIAAKVTIVLLEEICQNGKE